MKLPVTSLVALLAAAAACGETVTEVPDADFTDSGIIHFLDVEGGCWASYSEIQPMGKS